MLKVCGQTAIAMTPRFGISASPTSSPQCDGASARKTLEPARDYFLKKGSRELPAIEKAYAELISAGENEEAAKLLTDYTRDFFRCDCAPLGRAWQLLLACALERFLINENILETLWI